MVFSEDEVVIFRERKEIDLLRKIAYKGISSNYHKVLINQRKGNYRQIINIQDLIDGIYKELHVAPIVFAFENMNVTEQIRTMYSAKILVSMHGAGLSNIIFMRPKSILIEILPPNFNPGFYEIIAKQAGLLYGVCNNTEISGVCVNIGWHPLLNCNLKINASIITEYLKTYVNL